MDVLEQILQQFEKKIVHKAALVPMLDALKNQLIGRVHSPHPHFINHGVHSITMSTHSFDMKITS